MNHQDIKTSRSLLRTEGNDESGTRRLFRPVNRHLSPVTFLALCLGVLVVNSAWAQVPSHTPAYVPDAFSATTTFQPTGKPLVRVNGVVLTDRDLLREMLAMFPYARIHNGFPKAMEPDIRAGAMKMIVFEELVYQEAKHRGMTIAPAQMSQALEQFRQQFPSPQRYQQFLQEELQGSQKLLRVKVERSLLIENLLKEEVSDKAVVSEADVKTYYAEHPENFRYPESFAFQSISFLPPPKATPLQLQEAHQRAQSALRQAQATKSYEEFGLLAEKISDDDFRVMMGDHKAADRSKLPPVVVAAFAAMKPGQVSNIIEFAPNDFTILRLNAHNAAGLQPFSAVKEMLRAQLTKDKTEELRSALAARLSKNAKIEKA